MSALLSLLSLGAAPLLGQTPNERPASSAAWHQPAGATVVLDSTDLARTNARTLSEALAARVPALSVTRTSGMSGAGSRIVLRGSEAFVGVAEPLVFIDGMQVNVGQPLLAPMLDGTTVSQLDDIPLSTITRVELLQSPADMAAYGAGAARGVLLITTRAPVAARPHGWLSAHLAMGENRTTIAPNFRRLDAALTDSCRLYEEAEGLCAPGQLVQWSPAGAVSPFQHGVERSYRGGVAGQSAGVRLAASGSHDDTEGIFARNTLRRSALFVRGQVQPTPGLDVEIAGRLRETRRALPLGEGYGGILARAMRGSAEDDPITRGYLEFPLHALSALDGAHRSAHTGGAIHARWTGGSRAALDMMVGMDRVTQHDRRGAVFYTFDSEPYFAAARWSGDHRLLIAQAHASVVHRAPSNVAATMIAGVRHSDAELKDVNVLGFAGGTIGQMLDVDVRSTGVMLGERLVWRGNRELDVGARYESMSAFGLSLDSELLPWANLRWTISEEGFFPRSRALQVVRLHAGVARLVDPYQLQGGYLATFGSSVSVDPIPKALKQVASEMGMALAGWEQRVALEMKFVHRSASDGAYIMPLPVATGYAWLQKHGAEWTTTGVLTSLMLRPVSTSSIGWVAQFVHGSFRTSSGHFDAPHAYVSFAFWGQALSVEGGRDLVGYSLLPLTFTDPDGDGLLRRDDVAIDHDNGRFIGSPMPRHEVGWINQVTVGRRLVLTSHLDHRGGHVRMNATEFWRCRSGTCRGLHDPAASLEEQARAIAALNGDNRYFVEDATFTRLRELGARFELPFSVPGTRAAFVTASAHNLLLRTRFSGVDPEVGGADQRLGDHGNLFNAALPREFRLRLDLSM